MAMRNTSVLNMKQINSSEIIGNLRDFLIQHRLLAQILPSNGIVFQCDGTAPSPSKDYGQLEIHFDKVDNIVYVYLFDLVYSQVILRWWKISLRNTEGSLYPNEIKDTYDDFYHDEIARREVARFFGTATLDYCLNIARGHIDWLSCLPLTLQIHILSFVNLDDIPRLALVSKLFRGLCRHNDLWRMFYIRQHGKQILNNQDLMNFADGRGWRHVYFTNRLKLQMQLRRQAQIDGHIQDDRSEHVSGRQHHRPSSVNHRNESVVRRHSFITRHERSTMSPLLNRQGSACSQIDERDNETNRI
jgi:hypothetical protein